MKGSRSMKAVLPAVLGYDPYASLEDVKEGGSAQLAFSEEIALGTTASRRAEIADALSRYCKIDTWAMMAVARHLEVREAQPL
jgi:hypothetical protein